MNLEASFNEEHSECCAGCCSILKNLLDETVDVRDGKGNTRMHLAAANDKFEILRFLIKEVKWNINVTNNDKETPLNVAVDKLAVESVKILVNNNCDVNYRMANGETPLIYAIKSKNSGDPLLNSRRHEIINLLIKSRNIDLHEKVGGNTALHIAAANGNIFAVKAIINADPSLNTITDNNGNFAVHLAAENGHKSILELLIEKGNIDVDIRGSDSETLLQKAISCKDEPIRKLSNIKLWKGKFQIIEYLIDLNADCNAFSTNGCNVLYAIFGLFYSCCGSSQSDCKLESCVEECKLIREILEDQSKILNKKCVFLALAEYLIRYENVNIYKQNKSCQTPMYAITTYANSSSGSGYYKQIPTPQVNQLKSIVSYFEQMPKHLHFTKQKDQEIHRLETKVIMMQAENDLLKTIIASHKLSLPNEASKEVNARKRDSDDAVDPLKCVVCEATSAKDTTVCQLKVCGKCYNNHKTCVDSLN